MAVLLAEAVADRPDAAAVVDARGTTTWAELDERVGRLVHALRAAGLRSGDRVVTMLGNQVEMVEVSLACAHAGWILVPLNWHWVADEIAYVLADADASAVVVDVRWLEVVSAAVSASVASAPALAAGIKLVVGGGSDRDAAPAGIAEGFDSYDDLLAARATSPPADIIDPERGGPMFYTSGTTGRPKGVRSMLCTVGGPPEVFTLMAHSFRPTIDLPAEGGVQAICGPLYHSAQWVFAHFALFCGATLVLQHRFDAGELLDLIDRHRVTNLHLVPTQMVRLLDLPEERRAAFDGASLQSVMHGAAPCPPVVKRQMIEWLGPIVSEYYGGTEGGFISVIRAGDWLERPGSVGRPLEIIELLITDPDGEPVVPGQPGDIYFRNLMGSDFEYHNAKDKTAAAHRTGGFGTLGDIGYLQDGFLYLSDRRIDMIVSGGVNIYPAEIEGVLVEHPAVADAAVFGIPHPEMGEAVHSALALAPDQQWSGDVEDDVVAFCRERLAGYKQPRSFEIHTALPRSEAGKLNKRSLREPWWAAAERSI